MMWKILVIDRLQETDLDEHITEVKWHASCYSSFTNSAHIKRLQNRLNSNKDSLDSEPKKLEYQKRSSTRMLDWNLCLFCQNHIFSSKLHNVMVMRVSDKILHLAQFDDKVSCHLAGINDLIAAEGKYHLKCYVQFLRQHDESNERGEEYVQNANDTCLVNVTEELKVGLARGEILSFFSVEPIQ